MSTYVAIVSALLLMLAALVVFFSGDGGGGIAEQRALATGMSESERRAHAALAVHTSTEIGVATTERSDAASMQPEAPTAPRILRQVKGRCVDQRGIAVPRAYVGLATMPGWKMQFIVRADERGHVAFDWPAGLEGTPWIGGAFPGHQNQAFDLATFLKNQSDPNCFVLVLPQGETMRGRVVDVFGNGIAGAEVRMDLQSVEPTRTRADGHFHFDAGLPPGEHGVNFLAAGYLPQHERLTLPFAADAPIYVLHRQRSLRGNVYDEAGRPIGGVRIFATAGTQSLFADSSADGSFEILERTHNDAALSLEVRAGRTEAWSLREPVAWGESGIAISLRMPLTLEVRVVDAATREPIENYGVQMTHAERSLEGCPVHLRTEHKDGLLRIENLLRGAYHLRIHGDASRYNPSTIVPVVIADDVKLSVGIDLHRRPPTHRPTGS